MVVKRKERVDFNIGLNVDRTNKNNSLQIVNGGRYAFNQATPFSLSFFFIPIQFDSINILLSFGAVEIGYFPGSGLFFQLNNQSAYSEELVLNVGVFIDFVFDPSVPEVRGLINGREVAKFTYTAGAFDLSNQDLFIGKPSVNAAYNSNAIIGNLKLFNGLTDRKSGSPFKNYIEGMKNVGNWIHPDQHSICVGHWPLQETSGSVAFDCVSQYNHAKPQLKNDPYNSSGLASITKINESIGGSFINFDASDHSIVMYNGANCAASGGRPAFTFSANRQTKTGVEYTIEIDCLLENWYGVQVSGLTDVYLNPSGGVRTIHKLPFTEIANTVRGFTIGTDVNRDDITARFFSIRIYETLNPPLEGNHGDLINFDPADIAENGSARKDLKTRSTAILFDVDGDETRSGLPELKKALQLGLAQAGRIITIPASASTGIGTDNWLMLFRFYVSQDVSSLTGSEWIAEFLIGNGNYIIIYAGRIILANYGVVYGVGLFEDFNWRKGFFSLAIQKIGSRFFSVTANGIPVDVHWSDATSSTGFAAENVPYKNTLPEIDLSYNAGIPLYNKTAGKEFYIISAGIKRGNYTTRQLLDLHSNGRFANPKDIQKWNCYVNFNEYDSVNSRFTDLSGNGNHITQAGYTTPELQTIELNDLR